MRLFSHARDILTHRVGGDANEATHSANRQLAKFDQAANRADRDTAQLGGDFLKRPQQHGHPQKQFPV